MAANAKGKRKCKGKTLNLNTFLGADQDAPSGFAVVQTSRILDWGDTMDNEDLDDRYTLDFKKEEKVVLPTAPKAARGPDVDLSKVPTSPPYTAFLGNLPYDISEDDIIMFFRQLQVKNVRLPREGERGRIRGFGYAEFNNRQDLIQALALNNESLKNRAIKVSLAGEHDGDRDRRDGGSDRTMGDWRSDRRDQFSREDSSRDGYMSSRGGFQDREPYRPRSNYDKDNSFSKDRYERNGDRYDRSDYGYKNDREFGRDQDRFDRRSNDRGYGFSDRGSNRGGGRNDRRDGRDSRDNYGRREDSGRDMRYRDSSDRDLPPRDGYDRRPPDRPSYDSGSGPKERRKLQLAPRTKPIEPVPPPSEAIGSSSIFGGAKPVDTAAREREIEERLAREKGSILRDSKDRGEDVRSRKFSSGSGISNRSRRSSDSGPPSSLRDEEDSVPQYKPPIPRQLERESQQYNTLPRTRQRCSSNSSTGSERENQVNSKVNNASTNRKENYNSNYYARSENSENAAPRPHNDDSSYPESAKGGFRSAKHNSHRDNSRDRALHGVTYEEPKPPVYTSANKFSHLNDAEDLDRGSNSE
ncbi:Eukaryotic translation initiation factor 4B, partial [Stegodyphus mimosarum]